MSPIQGQLETEYLLTQAITSRVPVEIKLQASTWTGSLQRIEGEKLYVVHEIPLTMQGRNMPLELSWEQGNKKLVCTSRIVDPGTRLLAVAMPAKIIKAAARNFDRIEKPDTLNVSFSIAGTRYDLNYPQVQEVKSSVQPEFNENFDLQDLRGLIRDFSSKCEHVADDKRIIMFKDRQPQGLSEQLCAASGRVLYIPSLMGGLPVSDPFSESSILTRSLAVEWMKRLDENASEDSEGWRKLEQGLRAQKLSSLAYIPVIFQHYTIGLLYLAVRSGSRKAAIDLPTLDSFMQFAKVLSRALHIHGYFRDAPALEADFMATIVNVSAGGLLFSTENKTLIRQLHEGAAVGVQLDTGRRLVQAGGIVKLHYADQDEGFFGLQFTNMALEDFRYLFEYLYKRPFTDADANSLELNRILG